MYNLLFINICLQSLADYVNKEWMTGTKLHIQHYWMKYMGILVLISISRRQMVLKCLQD